MANIKVAVRVRPISARELNLTGSQVVVRADDSEISLTNLKVSSSKAGDSRERTRRYGFDYCFDSSDTEAARYADQAKIYNVLGQSVLDAVFAGYNSCLVAYGQTASGKTYTMMGTKEDPGLTPRLCEGLFARMEHEARNGRVYCVSVSYLEIYNERVRDLLKPAGGPGGLRVREHPRLGPYVQGLTRHVVSTLGSLMSYVEEGSRARKTASTLQNPSSSRSHALLTIALSEESVNVAGAVPAASQSGPAASAVSRRNAPAPRSASKLHLVDLAGSESAATCSGVHRLKEGANINKSLVALGNVISALAERGSTGSGPGRRFIPYRDSSLTWLLKDALGGNATTIMLATISPASGSYNETAHTLRFAQRAQSVVNRPIVNEDPVAKVIRELRAEVARLKFLLLEKDTGLDGRAVCNCGTLRTEPEADVTGLEEAGLGSGVEDKGGNERSTVRRSNSIEGIASRAIGAQPRRFGSYECLSTIGRPSVNYGRARVTELKDDGVDELAEISESVFVDIPTLVAVLIKPDNSLHEAGAQIEEICSDEVAEDTIDAEFLESANDLEVFDDDHSEKDLGVCPTSSGSSCVAIGDIDLQDVYGHVGHSSGLASRLTEAVAKVTGKLRKQESIDIVPRVTSTNLHTSRKFGSVETLPKRKEVPIELERSHTNLEKKSGLQDRGKKLNNIREIDDPKNRKAGSLWKSSAVSGSKEQLQRKGSNDSDRSLKDSPKSKGHARKPSLEHFKRKTSKDSSSSSSKDEQILVTSVARDKLVRRKSSLDQEALGLVSPGRPHTPIQRTKRAEIVAAVTERLYASRKPVEGETAASTSASGVRSPPEGTDVKVASSGSSTRSRLQELSRRMLAKRRRVCVDTQTDILHTVRVKDTGSLTELEHQDVGVLTDHYETCEFSGRRLPTLRVKDIATLTDKPKTVMIQCRDVGSLATDFPDFESDLQLPRNDSGILSDVTQSVTESDRKVVYTDSSTNTFFTPVRNSAVQAAQQNVEIPRPEDAICIRDCCKFVEPPRRSVQSSSAQTTPVESSTLQVPSVQPANSPGAQVSNVPVVNPERNVISISLPDMISITIESTNLLESRVAVMESVDHVGEKLKIVTRDGESQTETRNNKTVDSESRLCFKDFTRSTLTQTEGKVFRIENIFQDPRTATRDCSRMLEVPGTLEGSLTSSFTLRNSLGTSFATTGKDCQQEVGEGTSPCGRDGLISEAFIARKFGSTLTPWENWCVLPSTWQFPNNQMHVEDVTRTCKNESVPSKEEVNFKSSNNSPLLTNPVTSGLVELNTLEHEYNFSDDSLDYNVNTALKEVTILCDKQQMDVETHENLCPPDVVAHTKKELHKASNSAEASKENAEDGDSAASSDFEESCIEIPKATPNDPSPDAQPVHDYKTLIFGEPFTTLRESTAEPGTRDAASLDEKSPARKRVSFSNTNTVNKRREADKRAMVKGVRPATLKSIIKTTKVSPTVLESRRFSTDASDDSLQDAEDGDPHNVCNKLPKTRIRNIDKCGIGGGQDYDEILWNSKDPRGRFRVPEADISDTCSESGSYSSLEEDEDDEELSSADGWSSSVFEEYLSEAARLMRNMNSLNEHMNATRTSGRRPARSRHRGRHRQDTCTWNNEYLEYRGRKISLRDDTDKYLREEKIVASTDSYEKCLQGLKQLEDCIGRVDRQSEALREKYGIDCESAGARLSLASPSLDPSASVVLKREAVITDTGEATHDRVSSVSRGLSAQIHPGNNNSGGEEAGESGENLEKRIFDQLMNAVDSGRSWSLRRSRLSRCWSPSRTSEPSAQTKESTYQENLDLLGLGHGRDSHACDDSPTRSQSVFSSSRNYQSISSNYDSPFSESTGRKSEDSVAVEPGEMTNLGITDDWLERRSSRSTSERSREVGSSPSMKVAPFSKLDTSDIEDQGSVDAKVDVSRFREKLRYPGSPRARFLELLRERRRIVESSRGSSLS